MELVHFPHHHAISSLPSWSPKPSSLSCKFPHNHKWEINPPVLHSRFRRWGKPATDLFSTYLNKKCPRYCSRTGIGQHSLGDSLLLPWHKDLLCAFPLFPLLSEVLLKIKREEACPSVCSHLAETDLVPLCVTAGADILPTSSIPTWGILRLKDSLLHISSG